MSHIIIIREYRQNDESSIRDIVKKSLLSLANDAFISTLTKEITFQLIVLTAAIMFIFIGLPISYCFSALPIVITFIYLCIYINLVFKSVEVFQEKPYQCWVAESCEPFFFSQDPSKFLYNIITEHEIDENKINLKNLNRKVIGTVSLKKHRFVENSCWMYRLAVDERYRRKGVGSALIHSAVKWSKIRGFDTLEVSFSEHQDSIRELFLHLGFHLRQMYHRQIVGTAMTILKYQFGLELNNFVQKPLSSTGKSL